MTRERLISAAAAVALHVLLLLLLVRQAAAPHGPVSLQAIMIETLAPISAPKVRSANPRLAASTKLPMLEIKAPDKVLIETAPIPPEIQATSKQKLLPDKMALPPEELSFTKPGAAMKDYASAVSARLNSVKKFPREARYRGRHGRVIAELHILSNGTLQSWRLASLSGEESFDREAQRMVTAAEPYPKFPEDMKALAITILVPIDFTLAEISH